MSYSRFIKRRLIPEMMYAQVSAILHWFVPLRHAQTITSDVGKSGSNTERLRKSEKDIKMDRRRVSEAFEIFMATLETETASFSFELFSRSEREVPLSTEDRKVLGITAERSDLKRYEGVGIYSTFTGIKLKVDLSKSSYPRTAIRI